MEEELWVAQLFVDSQSVETLFQIGLKRGWHEKYAKWGHSGVQSLLAHALNVTSVCIELCKLLGVSPRKSKLARIAAFLHDFEKETEEFQRAVLKSSGDRDSYRHASIRREKEFRDVARQLGLSDAETSKVEATVRRAAAVEDIKHLKDLLKHPTTEKGLEQLVWLSDVLASQKTLRMYSELSLRIKDVLDANALSIAYHEVAVVRGILTQLTHDALECYYMQKGFLPLIYFAEGTVYVGKGKSPVLEEAKVDEAITNSIMEWLCEPQISKAMGEMSLGTWGATLIPTPYFLFYSDDTIRQFWSHIRARRAVDNPSPSSSVVDTLKKEDEALSDDLAKEMAREVSGFWRLLHALKEVLMCVLKYTEKLELAERADIQRMIDEQSKAFFGFGIESKEMKRILRLSNNTKANDRVFLWKRMRECLGKNREDRIDNLKDACEKISLRLRPTAGQGYSLRAHVLEISRLLLSEITSPRFVMARTACANAFEAYSRGKERGADICFLCGRHGVDTAMSSIVGEGTESFMNFLEGGSRIGGPNKMKICKLCRFEGEMRRLTVGNVAESIFVLPQINASRHILSLWQEKANAILDGIRRNGLSPLTEDSQWARVVHERGMDRGTREFMHFVEYAGTERRAERILVDLLKNMANGDLQFLLRARIPNLEKFGKVESFETAAELVRLNRKRLPESVRHELGRMMEARVGTAILSQPHFMLLLSRRQVRRGSESETGALLRKSFIGLLLARLLCASVVFPDTPLIPPQLQPSGGWLRLPQKLGLRSIWKQLGVDEWVPLVKGDDVLRRLAGLMLASNELTIAGIDYGKDTILEVAKRPAGMVVARHLQRHPPSMRLLRQLRSWKEV